LRLKFQRQRKGIPRRQTLGGRKIGLKIFARCQRKKRGGGESQRQRTLPITPDCEPGGGTVAKEGRNLLNPGNVHENIAGAKARVGKKGKKKKEA